MVLQKSPVSVCLSVCLCAAMYRQPSHPQCLLHPGPGTRQVLDTFGLNQPHRDKGGEGSQRRRVLQALRPQGRVWLQPDFCSPQGSGAGSLFL